MAHHSSPFLPPASPALNPADPARASLVAAESVSLIDLLAAQCSDLEHLLALARSEHAAVAAQDFNELMRLVSARATLGERIETYHRQIAELRARLGDAPDAFRRFESEAAKGAVNVILEIQRQDAQTHLLLTSTRKEASAGLSRLNHSRQHLSAYLTRNGHPGSVACDQRA